MHDLSALEKKVAELEQRLEKVEAATKTAINTEDSELMAALYVQAKQLVVRHGKASAVFLQRKLLIDLPRAEKILKRLEADGVIRAENELQAWRVLMEEK